MPPLRFVNKVHDDIRWQNIPDQTFNKVIIDKSADMIEVISKEV